MNKPLLWILGLSSLILTGAIFGFFYAWVCSTMWGLDAADPRVAIEAMQAMNASVRNAVFFPAFFLTPVVTAAFAMVLARRGQRRPALLAGAAAVIYLVGGLILTMTVNVPMNEALAAIQVPDSPAEAARIWADYSESWQVWNVTRTIASGISLVLVGAALCDARERHAAPVMRAHAVMA